MLKRAFDTSLRGLLRRFPVVTILGPRQCGKTTFVRQVLRSWSYLDLERPSDAAPLIADPEARLGQLGTHVILDEAHAVPGVFPVLRGIVDRRRQIQAQYVLLGSATPALTRDISESLAGRTAFLDLPPFRWDEVEGHVPAGGLASLWLKGGFPQAFLATTDSARWEWVEAYARALVERDLPTLGIDVSATGMRRLMAMLAHVNGGLWNASQLAASLGVSYHTVNRYVDILEQTFFVRKLAPYFVNIGKRLVKSPKVYVRDSGLLHYLLGIRSAAELAVHPARGASWEGFVIDQLISAVSRVDASVRPWCWRTAQGHEIDLLLEGGANLVAVEIKLHSAPTQDDAKGLKTGMSQLGLARGYVVYPGSETYSLGGGVTVLPASRLLTDRPALRRVLQGRF